MYEVYDKSIINSIVTAFGEIPAHEIGSREGVAAIWSLRHQFIFLGEAMEAFKAGPRNHPDFSESLKESIDVALTGRQRKGVTQTQFDVLAKNVRTQLDAIDGHYVALSNSIG